MSKKKSLETTQTTIEESERLSKTPCSEVKNFLFRSKKVTVVFGVLSFLILASIATSVSIVLTSNGSKSRTSIPKTEIKKTEANKNKHVIRDGKQFKVLNKSQVSKLRVKYLSVECSA